MTPKSHKKAIVCSRCGKRVGFVTLKWRFRFKLIAWGFVIALITQLLTQIPAEILGRMIMGN